VDNKVDKMTIAAFFFGALKNRPPSSSSATWTPCLGKRRRAYLSGAAGAGGRLHRDRFLLAEQLSVLRPKNLHRETGASRHVQDQNDLSEEIRAKAVEILNARLVCKGGPCRLRRRRQCTSQ
jgi:hypothetical protein